MSNGSDEQIHHRVQTAVVDRVRACGPDKRLRTIGDADIRLSKHGQIVRAVADCDAEAAVTGVLGTELSHPFRLDVCVDDLSLDSAGELAGNYLQGIGHGVIEAEALLQAFGEKAETT